MVTQTVIPRQNVIPGAQDDTYSVGSGGVVVGPAPVVLSTTVTITRDEMHDISTTPIEVFSGLGSGRQIVVLGVYLTKHAGAYTTTRTLNLEYTSGTPTSVGSVAGTHFGGAGTQNSWAVLTNPLVTVAPADVDEPVNASIQATANNDFAGAGGDVDVTVRYIEVE